MDERIKEHLKRLNRYYLQLTDLRRMPYKKFAGNEIYLAAAERILQTAIESCLNIGNRLISLLQFEKSVRTPESYADIFIIMRNLDIIDAELSDRLVKMARFRNRLVHLYWEMDPEFVYRILNESIDDFEAFNKAIVTFLNKNSLV